MRPTLALALCLLAACSTRPISNSGYPDTSMFARAHQAPTYRGELTEAEVLGLDPGSLVVEEDITAELDRPRTPLALAGGAPLLVVQSGADLPDDGMIRSLEAHFRVSVLSGVPNDPDQPSHGYSRRLRLAAARAGIDKLLVYWGVLESSIEGSSTKAVSWLPIVGWNVPDEDQRLRIRLKLALIDVRTGQWEMCTPGAFENSETSSAISREASDQGQVAELKALAYADAAKYLAERFVR